MTTEIFTNPATGVATAVILLVSVTAITFIAVLLLCGVRPEDLADNEGRV